MGPIMNKEKSDNPSFKYYERRSKSLDINSCKKEVESQKRYSMDLKQPHFVC